MGPPAAAPFALGTLLWPAGFIILVGFAVALGSTRFVSWSVGAAFAKAGFFLAYYAFYFNGTYTFLDDWTYLKGGKLLLARGVSMVNSYSHIPELMTLAGGKDFLYYPFNADSFRLFGVGYYAPVALNIALTFVAAALMVAVARRGLGFSRRLSAGLFLVIVLHPEVVAWSTIMNGKDTLVATGTVLAIFAVVRVQQRKHVTAILLGSLSGVVLFFTRFYVPLILVAALLIALVCSPSGRRARLPWLLAAIALTALLGTLGTGALVHALSRIQNHFVDPVYGLVRFALTPIPFHTTKHYAFLNVPELIQWVLMPFLLYGVLWVWKRRTLAARFIVIYFLLMMLLYAAFGTLQGPRHRVQIDDLIILFQFCGIVWFLRQAAHTREARVTTRRPGDPDVNDF